MGVTEYSIRWRSRRRSSPRWSSCLLVQLGRGLRWLYRWLARLLGRWIGPRAANATGWILVAAVTYLVVSGVLLDGLVSAANRMFSAARRDHRRRRAPAREQPALGRHRAR